MSAKRLVSGLIGKDRRQMAQTFLDEENGGAEAADDPSTIRCSSQKQVRFTMETDEKCSRTPSRQGLHTPQDKQSETLVASLSALQLPDQVETTGLDNQVSSSVEDEDQPCKFALARPVALKREIVKLRVVQLFSPFHFYVIEDVDISESFCLSGGSEQLQQVAKDMSLHQQRCFPSKLVKNKMYVILDCTSNKWHRCRLLTFDEEAGQAKVFYFDYHLEMKDVQIKDLREIPTQIAMLPITPTWRCHLYDIVPKDGSRVWDEETSRLFSGLVELNEQVLMGLPMSWNVRQVGGYEGADVIMDVGLILFAKAQDEASINWTLAKSGRAQAIGVGGLHSSNLFINEPSFSLVGVPKAPLPQHFTSSFPYEVGRRLPLVGITSIRSLDCIYVRLVSKHAELKAMEHFMQFRTIPRQKLTKESLKYGLPVLCMQLLKVDGVLSQRRSRGVVLKIFEDDIVTVLQVDSGRLAKVTVNSLYEMPEQLVKVPAFVHRIHLENVRPKSPTPQVLMIKWDSESRTPLQDFHKSLREKLDPEFFAVRRSAASNEGVVQLDEIHQPVAFYIPERKWRKVSTGRNHDSFKQMPMLASYFYSFGADVQMVSSGKLDDDGAGEAARKQSGLWSFHSLSRLLVQEDQFAAELIEKEEMNKETFYKALLDEYSF